MDFPTSSFINDPAIPDLSPSHCDSITSLMAMADKMEALLPPELDLSLPDPQPHAFTDCLSTVTSEPPSHPQQHSPQNITELSTTTTLSHQQQPQQPPPPPPPPELHIFAPPPSLALDPCTTPPTLPPQPQTATVATTPSTSPCALRDLDLSTRSARSISTSTVPVIQKPQYIHHHHHNHNTTPTRPKTARKPKTYSKPVASRFCHICSRMPRRGQGSATCRRMAEGFCRKIVCEQCLRDQGYDYEEIAANPANWSCPHCSGNCPPRSQCHIYNRINARRKRAGKQNQMQTLGAQQPQQPQQQQGMQQGQSQQQQQQPSVAAALASSDVLLGPYGHLLGAGGVHRKASEQILQPPPNFRLNLPPQYSQQ